MFLDGSFVALGPGRAFATAMADTNAERHVEENRRLMGQGLLQQGYNPFRSVIPPMENKVTKVILDARNCARNDKRAVWYFVLLAGSRGRGDWLTGSHTRPWSTYSKERSL